MVLDNNQKCLTRNIKTMQLYERKRWKKMEKFFLMKTAYDVFKSIYLSIYIINDGINFQLNRSNRLIINRMIWSDHHTHTHTSFALSCTKQEEEKKLWIWSILFDKIAICKKRKTFCMLFTSFSIYLSISHHHLKDSNSQCLCQGERFFPIKDEMISVWWW